MPQPAVAAHRAATADRRRQRLIEALQLAHQALVSRPFRYIDATDTWRVAEQLRSVIAEIREETLP